MTTHIIIDPVKLALHMELCLKHLNDGHKVCAHCPFEDIILEHYPEHTKLFNGVKRKHRIRPKKEGN